jgi:hypothetical protein
MSDDLIIEVLKLAGIGVTLIISILGLLKSNRTSKKIGEVHLQINSRMDELLKLNRESSKAEGNLEGRAQMKEEIKKP